MSNSRTADLILKAHIDQALQPLAQVTQRVKDLIGVLEQQRNAAQTADTTITEYGKALRDVTNASNDLLKIRTTLDQFPRRQEVAATQQAAADTKRQARDEFSATLLGQQGPATDAQTAKLTRLDTAYQRAQERADKAAASLQQETEKLQRLGILTNEAAEAQERLNAAHAEISSGVQSSTEALRAGQAQNDTLIATLRTAQIEKQVAAQRTQDAARFIADQEREAAAVIAAAETIRAKGRAAQEAADTGTVRNRRQDDIEAAFAEADAEARLQREAIANAKTLQVEQDKARVAAEAVFRAEEAAAEKARQALLAFQAEVAKAVSQGAAFQANVARQPGLIGAPVTLPATTLAAQVRTALAAPSGPGTGLDSLASVQAAVAHVTSVVAPGSAALKNYNQELRTLDGVSKSIAAQSQVVDNFLKARKAAEDATEAFRKAAVELKTLQATPRTAENLSEVTSAVAAKNRQIGSVETGTGLAAQAREAVEALAAEEAKLNEIGVSARNVGTAYRDLQTAALDTAKARQDILAREKTQTDAEIAEVVRRAAAISTAPGATAPTARGAVSAVAGAGRGGTSEAVDTAAAVDKLDASFKKTNITAQAFNRVMDEVFAIQNRIAQDASLIDAYTAQSAAVSKATLAFSDAQAELARVAAAARAGTASLAELSAAEARLGTAAAEVTKQATAQAALDAQLKARKIDTTALVAETNKLVDTTNRLNAVQERASAAGGKNTIFGLSQYQAQNLTFQVNDVITQLSLGQGVLRTFESQAGQIFQIFETSISALQRIVLYGLPAAAAIGAVVLALLRIKDTLDTQREFSRLLAANADGLAYQATQLTATARELEKFGVPFADATSAVKAFMRDGLSTEAMLQFGRTVKNVADVTGVTFAEALKQVGVLAHGSLDDISKLDRELNFLTTDQYAAIRAAAEAGHTDEARTIALNALTTKMGEGRNQGLAPLTAATRDLTGAYHEFLDAIGNTALLTGLVRLLADLAHGAAEVTSGLRAMFNPTKADADLKVIAFQKALDGVKDRIKQITDGGLPEDTKKQVLTTLTAQARELTRQLTDAKAAQDKLATTELADRASNRAGAGPNAPFSAGTLPKPFDSLPPPDSRINKVIPSDIRPIIDAAAEAAGVKVTEIDRLYRNEAARNSDGSFKTSSAGAVGALQVLPETFAATVKQFQGLFDALSTVLNKKIDINDPNFNILAGALYYKQQKDTFGNPALAAAAYNMGPGSDDKGTGVRGVLAGKRSLPDETKQYVSNFVSAQGGVEQDLAGMQKNAEATVRDAKVAVDVLDDIQKRAAAIVNETLRGSERVAADEKRVAEFAKQRQQEVGAQFTGPVPKEVQDALSGEIDAFRKKLADERDKQVQEANNAATQLIKSAVTRVDSADKANPAAARRVVDAQFDAALQALDLQIAKGATDALGASAIAARDKLLQLRDRARDEAAAAADRIVVDESVKARDELIGKVQGDLSKGTLSLSDAFKKIAEIIAAFKPQIDKAIATSNKDLATLPQTPAVQAQIAKNQSVDTSGRDALKAADEAGIAKVNELISARDTKVKELNDDVANGRKTQTEANTEITQAYAKSKTVLDGLIDSLQKQLDLQKQNGEIAPEVYDKLTAQLQRAKGAADDLNSTTRKFVLDVENSIASRAVQGLDEITTAIGKGILGTEKWGDVIRDVGAAFGNFAAGVLKDIAGMIAKQVILNALQDAFKGTSGGGFFGLLAGGGGAAASGAASSAGSATLFLDEAATFHGGGVVGPFSAMRRQVNPAAFVGAPRMHEGGMVGMASGERAAVLQDGEEVLTNSDWRHRDNNPKQGNAQGTAQSIRNVLVFKDEDIAGAISGQHGETVVLQHIRRNASSIRQMIGAR